MLRLSIDKTRELIVAGTPTCVEALRFFQSKGGWISLPPEIAAIRERLKINNYVVLYDDPRKISMCFLCAFMQPEEIKAWDLELSALPLEKQQEQLEEFVADFEGVGDAIEKIFDIHRTADEKRQAEREFDALPEAEKQKLIRVAQFLWSGFLTAFHNIVAVMVHGETLTSLVPKAIAGDDEAFCKAIQIDRRIYSHHPYFLQRIENAQSYGEAEFLSRAMYRLQNPTARSKIRYPGLWTVLASLDTLGWLDDLTGAEILDICDAAGLHRWENRIEDPLALNKRVRAYKKMQKNALLSSH